MQLSKATLGILGGALLVSLATASQAQTPAADKIEKPWLVRLRALSLTPANKSDAFSALETNFAANSVRLSKKTFPEIDISRTLSKNLSVELVLTYPQRHDVTLTGAGKLGTIDHLPPTLLGQYRFAMTNPKIDPYVGAGFNYTRITRSRLSVSGTALDVGRSSFGLAYQAGVDIEVGDNLFLNLDYKRLKLATNVKVAASGAKLTRAHVDPDLISIGIGKRF